MSGYFKNVWRVITFPIVFPFVIVYYFFKMIKDAIVLLIHLYHKTSGKEVVISNTKETTLLHVDGMDGVTFEHFSAQLLQKMGFQHIQLTKASGDQGVDILAEKDGIRYAIQCKCYSSKLGNTSVQEIHAGTSMYNCHVGVVLTNQYFTPGAKELAVKTGVLLWDRDWLLENIQKYCKS